MTVLCPAIGLSTVNSNETFIFSWWEPLLVSNVQHYGLCSLKILNIYPFNIVTCRPVAGQRLGKHINEAYALNNRTSTARQRRGKQASSTIQAVFREVRAKCL
jgi:hypothetical protein